MSSLTKKFSLVLLTVFILACENVKIENKSDFSDIDAQEITNHSVCVGPSPVDMSIYRNEWKQNFLTDEGISVEKTFRFSNGFLSMAATCTKGTATSTAYVSVKFSSTGTQVTTTSSDSHDASFVYQGVLYQCRGEILSGIRLLVSFQGPCLKLQEGSRTHLMVPTTLVN